MSKRIPFIVGLLLLFIAIWLQVTHVGIVVHFIDRLEDLAYDLQLRAKLLTQNTPLKTTIAIVDIDDKSLSAEGRWPWSREKLAALVTRIQQDGAVVIAFDVIFPEQQSNVATDVIHELEKENLITQQLKPALEKISPLFDEDTKFAQSLKQIDSVLGISFLPTKDREGALSAPIAKLDSPQEKQLGFIDAPGVIGNTPVLQTAAKSAGFVNVFPDDDGVIRHVPVLIRFQDALYPSLALEAVRVYLLSDIHLVTASYGHELELEGIKIGDNVIPTNADAEVIVPFRGPSFTFPYYSATNVLHNKIPDNALTGKIVFIGTSATGLGDLRATAIQSIYPGVEVQATIADGILNHTFPYKPAWVKGLEIFMTVLLGLIFVFTFPYLGPLILSLVIILTPIILIFANSYLWEKTGLIISAFIPMSLTVILAIINIIYGYLFETRKRERLKEMFGQYVPEKHIDEMLTSSGEYGLLGDDRDMTVLFADIRNFTSISEPLTAAQLKEMLNEFLTSMTEIIFTHQGTIDKYVGDLVMAFWGAPLKDKRHAQHAIAAAVDMQAAVEKLKPVFAEKNWAEINIGIGLNSGIMSVGDMGSKFRRNYTVLGDAVNLASRLESLTKFYGAKIMVSESTQTHSKNFIFRKADRVRVKGKKNGVEIYEVLGHLKMLTPELKNELDLYHTALEDYFHQRFEKARVILTELNQAQPQVKLYSLYLSRIEEFTENPPASDWDGIYTHATK